MNKEISTIGGKLVTSIDKLVLIVQKIIDSNCP